MNVTIHCQVSAINSVFTIALVFSKAIRRDYACELHNGCIICFTIHTKEFLTLQRTVTNELKWWELLNVRFLNVRYVSIASFDIFKLVGKNDGDVSVRRLLRL